MHYSTKGVPSIFRELSQEKSEKLDETMSEPDMAKPRHRRVSSPCSEPTRSPSPISVPRSIITPQTSIESESSSVMEVKEESHDLILSEDDENWTLQMEDDEDGDEEEVIEVKKITDLVRESFKKEGEFFFQNLS